MSSRVDSIHLKLVEVSQCYLRAEAELVGVLAEVIRHRVFVAHGYPSVFAYVCSLGLSENIAYSLITVARKSLEVPELSQKLERGEITLTNARRVAAVLTVKNQSEWLKKASELSSRKLEKEIARERPEMATPEKATYVSENRVKLELGLSEIEMLKLRKIQDLESQRQRRSVTLEETLQVMSEEYLKRHDPVRRAKRQVVKKPSKPLKKLVAQRRSVPAPVLHAVNLRDERMCTFRLPDGSRCTQRRFLEIHHLQPFSQGGPSTLQNLTTLCQAHHQYEHS
jgi:hypothetical protein